MAPPSARRPGFSRKAHFGLFLGYVVAVGGVLLALLLLLVAILDRPGFNALRSLALDATAPVTVGGRNMVRAVQDGGGNVANYFGAAAQNAELKRRLQAAERRLVAARVTEFENRRLKRLLHLEDSVADEIATGRIVGSTFDSSRRLATLSVGASSGVSVGQPVRAPDGLVGRILETGRWASRVLLVTDGANTVPVLLVRGGVPALATGRGDGTVELKTLEVGRNPFRRGDIVVTSGVGGIYPPGVPVARVVEARRDTTIARPLADPARIEYAIVQRQYLQAASQPITVPPATASAVPAQ
jgi:rod shape-determining protein MreC